MSIQIHILPGGQLPTRQSDGAVGFDAFARAIVSPTEMDGLLRKTIADMPYPLAPGQRVTVGLGFVTRMQFPMFYWVAPRSGLASKFGITVANAPGTVDPDYRGEAGAVLLNNGSSTFVIEPNMRIVQLIFQRAEIPDFIQVETHEQLLDSQRGTGGFGSTGLGR